MPIRAGFEIDAVDDVDRLAQQPAVLHIIVVIRKGGADYGLFYGRVFINRQIFQGREKLVIDKI